MLLEFKIGKFKKFRGKFIKMLKYIFILKFFLIFQRKNILIHIM
jgi:hypothetical protein